MKKMEIDVKLTMDLDSNTFTVEMPSVPMLVSEGSASALMQAALVWEDDLNSKDYWPSKVWSRATHCRWCGLPMRWNHNKKEH